MKASTSERLNSQIFGLVGSLWPLRNPLLAFHRTALADRPVILATSPVILHNCGECAKLTSVTRSSERHARLQRPAGSPKLVVRRPLRANMSEAPSPLTRHASFAGESEKADPNWRHRAVAGEPAQRVAPLGRGSFPG